MKKTRNKERRKSGFALVKSMIALGLAAQMMLSSMLITLEPAADEGTSKIDPAAVKILDEQAAYDQKLIVEEALSEPDESAPGDEILHDPHPASYSSDENLNPVQETQEFEQKALPGQEQPFNMTAGPGIHISVSCGEEAGLSDGTSLEVIEDQLAPVSADQISGTYSLYTDPDERAYVEARLRESLLLEDWDALIMANVLDLSLQENGTIVMPAAPVMAELHIDSLPESMASYVSAIALDGDAAGTCLAKGMAENGGVTLRFDTYCPTRLAVCVSAKEYAYWYKEDWSFSVYGPEGTELGCEDVSLDAAGLTVQEAQHLVCYTGDGTRPGLWIAVRPNEQATEAVREDAMLYALSDGIPTELLSENGFTNGLVYLGAANGFAVLTESAAEETFIDGEQPIEGEQPAETEETAETEEPTETEQPIETEQLAEVEDENTPVDGVTENIPADGEPESNPAESEDENAPADAENPDNASETDGEEPHTEQNIETGTEALSLSGSVPEGVAADAVDALEQVAELDLAALERAQLNAEEHADEQESLPAYRVLTAWTLNLTQDNETWQPDEDHPLTAYISHEEINAERDLQLWHVRYDEAGNPRLERIEDCAVQENTLSFPVKESGLYMISCTAGFRSDAVTVTGDQLPAGISAAMKSVAFDASQLSGLTGQSADEADMISIDTQSFNAPALDLRQSLSVKEFNAVNAPLDMSMDTAPDAEQPGESKKAGESGVRYEVITAYDISLYQDEAGYQPDAEHPLTITIRDEGIREAVQNGKTLQLWHVHEGAAPVQVENFEVNDDTVSFRVEDLSVFVVTYTVDFHWGDYIYNMKGEGEITLSSLLEKLGVTEITAADVANVTFSNPEYIAIEQLDSDWLLRSLAPFSTEEALTLTLQNGQSVEIKVTDEGDGPGDETGDKTDPEVTAPTAREELVYTGKAQELVNAGSTSGGTMLYRVGQDGEYSAELPTAVNAGEYTIYYKVEGNEQYNDFEGLESLTASIAPKAVTVKANDASKTYGDADPALTATVDGTIGEDTVAYTVTRAEGETVGEYAITVSGEAEQGNYRVTYTDGVFTVARRSLQITAASESRTYDGYVLSNDEFTAEGLVEGHAVQSVVHEGAQTDVGTCPNLVRDAVVMNPAVTDAEGNPEIVTENYEISYTPGTLEVTKKPITITADSAEKVYDGTALTEAGYTSTGLADGDVFDGMTVNGSQTQVGESENVPSEARIVRPDPTEEDPDRVVEANGNYEITYANGTLKVTQRELTITADSAEKVYDGTALTRETYTAEGLAEGDSIETVTVTGSRTDAGKGDNVPSEAKIVNADGEDISANYKIVYKNGTLEVRQKNVKLTAKSGVEVSDGSEKTISGFTVSAEGKLLSGITFAAEVLASGSGAVVGDYPVTFSGVTLDETTDTTGNYLVTETENGTLRITESAPLEKALTGFNGNAASYKITINPNGLTLNGGQNLTLKDTFTYNQSIDYASVTVSGAEVPYDYSDNTGTFTIPDATPVTITYKTRVAGAAGTQATFGNTAELGVTRDGSFAPWTSVTVSDTRTITPTGTDIEGTDGVYTIRLFTYVQNHMEQGLGGAVFRLLDSNQRPIFYRAGEHAGEIVTFTTGNDGYVDVALDDGIVSLRKNTIYYLEMITAPVLKNSDDSYTYFQKDNTLYNFLITDDPSYNQSGVYRYFNGDVLKVRCYSEAAGVNVTKRFSGNYSLTKEQQNQIRFILQKEDLATDSWVTVEEHTYADFSYGSLNFKIGREGGAPLEPAVVYRLIEETQDIEGIDHSSSVTLNYQRDNVPVQENINEFEVNPDHSTYSFSLVYDNAYVDHKLTIVKLNELTGALLTGAKFTVYKALDNSEVKTYETIGDGVLEIRRNDDGADYVPNTAYYVMETKAPTGYLKPLNPEKIYFYFSEDGSGVPEGIPGGITAVDLTTSYDAVVVNNHAEAVTVPVTVTWNVDGSHEWPDDVGPVEISLYQSVNGGEPVPVKRKGAPMTVTLSKDENYDNTTFVDLPARDEDDNDITYSVVQKDLPGYYTSYKVSGTGWYVVRNESAVSVTVTKKWYDQGGNPVDDADGKQTVAFDLYRTTTDHPEITTRDGLEAILRGLEPVRTGLTLSAENDWTNTVDSLQKQNEAGQLYYYFALEREDSMPRNNEDSYVIDPADGDAFRTLTIKNTQTPITVIIRAMDFTKAYGQDDPTTFTFTTEVQDDECRVSQPVLGEDGKYSVTVTKGEDTKQITFTCAREPGENEGSYAIELTGEASQEGYRVRLDDGTLTINPAQVTVKGTATKVYGNPDPSLVEITGLKEGDTIAYYAYRDIGEQKGSYRITVTGKPKQGNYEITYINDYLTIQPASVTVTADNISKAYGQAEPTLTVTIDGLKNQDAASVIKYTISREKQGTDEGESVGEYPITVTGEEAQGNYTVSFVNGTFTISGHKVTVRAKNLQKTYGDADPAWEAKVTGKLDGETIEYTFTRQPGEDVGTYVVTPVGETAQGNAEVIYETGILTINKANLTVTPVNLIKALTDPITPDPQLTVSFDKLVNHDDEIVPTTVYDEGTKTWTYTYTREGKTEPEFGFTLTRTPGETAGPYIIAATAFGERPKNYNITYKTGIFTILTTYNVVLTQQTRDLVDYTQNPEYSYKAVLDPEAIGIETYNAGGFVNNEMSFTLPAEGNSSKTLHIPSGAKLTVTQETTNPDYTTAITLDTEDVEGTSVKIEKVNKAASIVVTHERIVLPVEARAAQRQTDEGKADENGAVAVTPLAYLGIPRDTEKNPIPQTAESFIRALDAQGVYNLPEDMYYVPEHASVYNGGEAVATDIQTIRYDEENKVWQYSTDGTDFTAFQAGEQLKLFYMPKYICRVQADEAPFYTLNEALAHIDDITPDGVDAKGKTIKLGSGTIEMLIDYTMPAADALTIPANFNITLTSAEGTKTILRKPSNLDHMISNSGTLTLDSIVIDGNRARVTANNAMVLNNGTLTVTGNATLQNASGNNGGAIYANSGSVTVDAGATFTGNSAVNGGAIYLRDGSLSIASENISHNSATYGGAVYMTGGTFNNNGSVSSNNATNGGAVYMAGGTLNTSGAINSNEATTGGAVFMTDGTLNLTAGTVDSNNAANGGAFYLTGGKLNMSGGTVSGNTATENGGAFYSSNTTVSITGGSITGNSAASGGAILLESGKASVGGAAVQGNSASNFGGAVCQTGGTLTVTGTIDGANSAKNGSAVYVKNGSATFDGCNITENTATAGGAIGVGSTEARLHFTGNAKVTGNTWNGEAGNLYLDLDSDLIINTAGLGLDENANIGVRVKDDLLSTRGDVACKFGTYTVDTNLSGFKNDVNTGLIACADNYKIIWSKPITVNVIKLNSYATTFPPSDTTAATTTFSYNPKSQTNNIYDLVMEMYNAVYKSSITGNDLYAYSFASTATDFSQFLSAINWDSENQHWDFVERSGDKATGNPNLKIYYSNGAYISIVNNSAYDLTVDSMSVLGKDVPFYGYPTVKNNITLETLTPVTAEDLVLKSGENIKLLFPGAVNRNWTLTGTFTDPTTHEPVPNASYEYTLGRNDNGQKQSGTANGQGKITHSGKTKNAIGGSYEILFGNPTYICKVTDGGVEHPFPTLKDAWNYIVDNDLTYTMEDGSTMPGGTIEMLIDYLQPRSDVLEINESSFTGIGKEYKGYCLKLTTAATSGVQYPYVGQTGVTRATISRDSDNDGAAVIAMPYKGTKAYTESECDAFLIVDNLTFDGKALAKKGNGGAISTANNVVTITRCDFKGYQAVRGGAVFVAWGALTVGGDDPYERCTFSNCSTGDSSGDKIGGGGIWTSAQNLVVKNADFDTCACIVGNSQGGAIFHNIRPGTGTVGADDDKKSIYKGGDSGEYAIFPEGYSLTSTTRIEGCTFKNCYSVGGSGGTIECDSMVVTIKGSSFDGSYSNKSNANGGAVNILHNDSFGLATVYPGASLTVIDSTFNNCQTNTGASYGGAICDQNSVKTEIINCYFNNCSSNRGGAIVTNREKKIPTDITDVLPNGITVNILGSRFEDCTARTEGGAVHTTTTKLTISDTYKNDKGQDVTAEAWFKNCSAPSYGGVYQDGIVTGSEVTVDNVYFDSCSSSTGNAGALMVNARTLSITGTARENEDDSYTFKDCTAGSSGGAVYHSPKTTVKDTLTDVSFYNCSAKAEGGGARLASAAIEISGAEVRNCEAVTNGGGLYVSGATTIEDCVFSGNKATGETGNGGSIYFNSGTSAITGGSISDSIAVNGGGIYNKGTLTISKGTEENSGTITNCAARTSGGGIYATGAVTLSDAVISDCYAVTSGGGIYHTGNLYPNGKITKCYAEKGGGVYSANGVLTASNATASMEISDCHAATVMIADDGTATAEKEYKPENQGGGIYRSATNNDASFGDEKAVITGCSAYDGGGVYFNSSKKLTFSNGSFTKNTAMNNGGAIYKNGTGSVTMSGGVIGGLAENANHAQYGSAIFVADGQSITLGGGRITHNVAEVGGAVAVGGNNAKTQLLFQGAPVIRNNTNANGEKCNVFLNYDTNGIIRTSGIALTGGAYIGVYVTDDQFDRHGNYTLPFGTYNKTDNLSSFYNDRIYAGGLKGSSNIVWGEFICKITDGDGNLLYTDTTCEAPAVYTTLENNGNANTTSAFGMLSNNTVNLYNANGIYSGNYQIQMLVENYTCESRMSLPSGKTITLTTAEKDAEDGFPFTGTGEFATISRGGTFNNSWITNRADLTLKDIIMDGQNKESNDGNSNSGGIICNKDSGILRIKTNATLRNSGTKTAGGGAVGLNGSTSKLYMEGGLIENCFASNSGGAVLVQNAGAEFYMSGGSIVNCSAKNGGAVYGTGKIYMSGGSITGNSATAEAGGIDLRGAIRFSGNPVVSGNTLNGNPCNLHLINNNNTSIYADGLGPFAEIRVYTTSGTVRNNRGVDGKDFGTWTSNENLHCFINDLNVNLRGMKTADDKLIYWRTNPILTVGKGVDSDRSADKDVEFDFTVTIVDHGDFSGTFEDMTFVDGVATFRLKAGQVRTASGLPFDFIHNGVNYTVTETLAEGQTAYTAAYSQNGGTAVPGTSVTGHFGENMSEDQSTSTSVSSVMFTNTRTTDDLTISKTVTEGITGDDVTPFAFTVTLDDTTITKTYSARLYQDETDTEDSETTVSFTNGVGTFQLTHGQAMKIIGLPTELGFKVEEILTAEQYANFRAYVTAGSAEEILSYSATGKIGELKNVAFRNNRYGLVCKIVNDTAGREQLYYRAGNVPTADPTPAIFDELEKAFETISGGINLFTADGASADVKLRVEMVKPHYEMNRQAVLAEGYNVTLGTALKTDGLYPYPTDADMPAVVTRGYNDSSMIVDNGNLTLDNITLDGGSKPDKDGKTYTSTENGGIVRVNGTQTLTVTENAILRNSVSTENGGAIWIGATAGLTMNGAITDCEAAYGGGVYANNGFGGVAGEAGYLGVSIGGTISGCKAAAGNGGAIYAGTATIPDNIPNAVPMVLTGSATLSDNRAVSVEGNNDTGRGGALYCATHVDINSADVTISNNTAAKDGGGIYQSSESNFTMSGGTVSNNTAAGGNAGGIWANHIAITGGTFSGNKANGKTVSEDGVEKVENGKGGAIYTKTTSEVSITGTTFEGNEAYQGGALYDQAKSFTVTDITMTGNSAADKGGAVYVTGGHSFTMSGGSISGGNKSPEGAVSTGEAGVLNFSGGASVSGNTANDGTTAMNVYLGYHSNTIIKASSLTGTDPIGVYVKDGTDNSIYHNHGIANRPFGTGRTESEANLNKFVNDRDNSLTGVRGPGKLIMWPGKDLVIQVYQNKANAEGKKTTPVGGAKFKLTNENGITVWSGESNATTGIITIPWGITEAAESVTADGGTATFTKQTEGKVSEVSYILSQQQADKDTVLPAGTWKLTVGMDNAVTWEVIPYTDPESSQGSGEEGSDPKPTKVNRTINVEPGENHYIGETFLLYNDVKPRITFDPNGGILSGKTDTSSRTDTVNFTPTEISHTYKIEEPNPTRENAVFRIWSTVKNPVDGDGHEEYKYGEEILFYRDSDDDDLTLYAQWSGVVCKITDTNDNLLYVNGSPAVYMSLKEGFDAFNEASFTHGDGSTARPRKLKMLVSEYEMTETVELARGKIMEFMTAPSTDADGYAGPTSTCVITRASSFDTGSMIIDNYNLAIRDLTLDGAVKDDEGNPKPITTAVEGNDNIGGIIKVTGTASHLTLAQDAVLRNALAEGNGGAVYAAADTIVTISEGGSITGCKAANGGAIYADASSTVGASTTVNLSGGEISGNTATVKGGAVYAAGTVNMTGSSLTGNSAADGGGLYLSSDAELTMSGGTLSANSAQNGGGVYSDGGVTLSNASAVISGNTATANGGGIYVSDSGSLSLTACSVGASGSPNTAANGGGVYLAGKAALTGGSISYNTASGKGGGLYLSTKSEITLNGTELSHNQAANGGAVYAVRPASGEGEEDKTITLTLDKSTISNNTASGNGGGMYLESGVDLSMTGGTLSGNSSANGGSAYVASGSTMTLSGGTVSGNTAKRGADDTTGNGAGVYVAGDSDASYGVLRVESGSINGNKAGSFGGAVYLQGYGQLHVSGGTISYNAADDTNGGAINAEGIDARIYLSGTPTIFNNPDNATTHAQKNLVLSVDQNTIINTAENGLDQKPVNSTMMKAGPNVTGIVGVYVIDDNDVYTEHGVYDKPFGTFANTDEKRNNAKNLVNDRNLALYGVQKEDNIIYWKDVVCKITDASDTLLYRRVNVDDSGVIVYAPAVYTSLFDGFDAASTYGSLYRKSGSRYAVVNTAAVKIKMLKDYELDESEIIYYSAPRDVTLTTAETENIDGFFYKPSVEGQTRATLTRAQTTAPMFTMNTSNRFNVSDIIIDGDRNSITPSTDFDGGAFNIMSVNNSTFSGVTLKNLNAAGSGGAIYLDAGSLALTNSDITNNSAGVSGGAVYVNAGAAVTLSSGTINGNTATEGAGIYLAENSTLYLSGSPNFGGTGTANPTGTDPNAAISGPVTDTDGLITNGNYRIGELSDATNGQQAYHVVRQDIYVSGYDSQGSAADSIVVTGAIDLAPGSVWVWCAAQEHYEMLKQFAVFGSTAVKNALQNTGKLESTMQVFRNAQIDLITGCGADYLTGQEGDDINGRKCIYWTGGFDFVFRKIDGNGKPLDGATFTLYKADNTGTAIQGAYQVNGSSGKVDATATSRAIAQADAVTIKYTTDNGATISDKAIYGDGLVAFAKIPPATYFLVETTAPEVNGKAYATTQEKYRIVLDGKGWYTITVEKNDSGASTWTKEAITTRFANDGSGKYTETDNTSAADTVKVYEIMNLAPFERKVILRKTAQSDYEPLEGAVFEIYRMDDTLVPDPADAAKTSFTSTASGVYFIGKLPYGTYYLHEITAPTGYSSGKWFTLTVSNDNTNGSRDGVTVAEITVAAHITELQNFVKP